MKAELLPIFEQLISERNVDRHVLVDAMITAIETAAKKSFYQDGDVVVDFHEDDWTIEVNQVKVVVQIPMEPALELTEEEAQVLLPGARIGDMVKIPVPPTKFGRIAAQTAKQVIIQKIKEAERENVYNEYKEREGDVVTGAVKKLHHGNVIVDIGRAEGLIPYREQSSRDNYRFGERLRCYILEVNEAARGPQIILSRSSTDLVRKLFAFEVPEIGDGTVEIRGIAREAGFRTKIAVQSHDSRVDPVGACVGMKGIRVRSIVEELRGEKIDVMKWHDDPAELVASALQPAEISGVTLLEEEHKLRVTVPSDKLSLAIGKRGQNARLAARIVGWELDIVDEEEVRERPIIFASDSTEQLLTIPGVSDDLAEQLREAGFTSPKRVADATVEQLTALPDMGEKTAERIIESAQSILPARNTTEEL